jgi:hypothetical protein
MTAQELFHDFVRGPRRLPILLERLHPLSDDVELLLRHGRVVLLRVGVVRDGPGLAHGIRLRLWAGLGKGPTAGPPDGGRVESNSRTVTPKHRVEPATTRHQNTGQNSKINNPERSAKPPSPVQIRAAPPNSIRPFW